LFMVLLAAFQTLLGRMCGQEDVSVGSLAPGRSRPEAERVVGPFENPIVLRTDLSGNPTFSELLARVRGVAIGAFANQELPHGLLVEELHRAGRQIRGPLFSAMFTLQSGHTEQGLAPLATGVFPLRCTTTRWDLGLEMVECYGPTAQQQHLRGVLRYSSELFDMATIDRLVERYLTLLADVARNPHAKLSELTLDQGGR
jgi:non-ribosomal peptide synthetase component F